jgi:hypothetical protein
MSMQEAVGRFVPDGASVCMGTALKALIPFAAGFVRRIQAAWVGNVSAGLGHNYHGETRTVEGARPWLDHWIFGVADSKGFLSTLGPDAREAERVKTPRLSEPLDYGD